MESTERLLGTSGGTFHRPQQPVSRSRLHAGPHPCGCQEPVKRNSTAQKPGGTRATARLSRRPIESCPSITTTIFLTRKVCKNTRIRLKAVGIPDRRAALHASYMPFRGPPTDRLPGSRSQAPTWQREWQVPKLEIGNQFRNQSCAVCGLPRVPLPPQVRGATSGPPSQLSPIPHRLVRLHQDDGSHH
jgi:hypothetical protein